MSQCPRKSLQRRQPLTGDEIVLSDFDVARMLGVARDTVLEWRRRGVGPPYSKVLGVKAVYLRTRLIEYLDSLTVYNDGADKDDNAE